MSAPVNLNKARKARARAAKKVRADANAVTFGMTKVDRKTALAENSRQTRELDAKVLDMPRKRADGDPEKP
ncbi:MAG: DUF4169 family protein [Pseudomonadota bacterium]